MDCELVEAWRVNVDTNQMLLDGIPDAGLGARYSPRTRSVCSQFAHMHNVRVDHLKRRAKALLGGLETFGRGAEPDRQELTDALAGSDEAIAAMLAEASESGRVKSWHPGPTTFLGYLLAHEAHHRGLVIVSLRIDGHKLHKDLRYGLWYWSRKRN
jgi:uncharacterized damage-inducible protein DinB